MAYKHKIKRQTLSFQPISDPKKVVFRRRFNELITIIKFWETLFPII